MTHVVRAGFNDAVFEFNRRVQETVAGGATRAQAVRAVAEGDALLHRLYLAEVNTRRTLGKLAKGAPT
jgi:hypothetical protein